MSVGSRNSSDTLSFAGLVMLALALGGCRACQRESHATADDASVALSRTAADGWPATASRCRRLGSPIPLADTPQSAGALAVGDVAVGEQELLVGLHRMHEGRRVASLLRASLDLSRVRFVDVGSAFGDDPPPSPRWLENEPRVVVFGREAADGGGKRRQVRILKLAGNDAVTLETTLAQPSDESNGVDVVWTSGGKGLAVWDEDAPGSSGSSTGAASMPRGLVKVRALPEGAERIVTAETTDAESPKLATREGGGFWLGYVAQRSEKIEHTIEGPGEARSHRWIEVIALSGAGEPLGPARRVSSERGHAVGFELLSSESGLVVALHDEASAVGDVGGRLLRVRVLGDRIEAKEIARGVGHAVADVVLLPSSRSGAREAAWLSWSDTSEHSMLLPLRAAMEPPSSPSEEPLLEGARVLGALRRDELVALVGGAEARASGRNDSAPALQRFSCAPAPTSPDAGGLIPVHE
jgi:hypothetical protein